MLYSEKYKFVFIHIHRTGGSSIANILFDSKCQPIMPYSQHENAKTANGLNILEKQTHFYKFAFVRNPWERIFSWYTLITNKGKELTKKEIQDFEDFVEPYYKYTSSPESGRYFHFNQLDYVTNKNGHLLTDKIGRFENLQEDLESILSDIKIPTIIIPKVNAADRLPYSEFYTKKTRKYIYEKCIGDIECFNYSFYS